MFILANADMWHVVNSACVLCDTAMADGSPVIILCCKYCPVLYRARNYRGVTGLALNTADKRWHWHLYLQRGRFPHLSPVCQHRHRSHATQGPPQTTHSAVRHQRLHTNRGCKRTSETEGNGGRVISLTSHKIKGMMGEDGGESRKKIEEWTRSRSRSKKLIRPWDGVSHSNDVSK